MELRLYWQIVMRRWWIVACLLVILGASHLLWDSKAPAAYQASMRFVVGLSPEPGTGSYYTYDRYYTWLTAEYLVDDLAEVIKSRAFADDVAATAGVPVAPGAIQGATSAGKLHRILNVSIQWGDPQQIVLIANAVSSVLQERGHTYFAQLATERARITLIDPPQVGPVGRSLRQRMDLPLRLLLALVAGIGLTFLLDYLDDAIRHRGDVETLGVPILGEIPGRRRWVPWQRRRSAP